MHDSIKPIKTLIEANNMFFDLGIMNLSDELASKTVQDGSNTALWLLGHIVESRYNFNMLLGSEDESPYKIFNKSVADLEGQELPSVDELKTSWDTITKKLFELLEKAEDDQLNKEPKWKFPTSENTVLAALTFMALHETYHAGQLSTHRKMLDMKSIYALAMEAN